MSRITTISPGVILFAITLGSSTGYGAAIFWTGQTNGINDPNWTTAAANKNWIDGDSNAASFKDGDGVNFENTPAVGPNIDALKTSLENLRTYVNGLTNQEVSMLVLSPRVGEGRLIKADLLQRIDDALNLVPQFQQQLTNANIQPNPGAAAPIPVNGAGRVDVGQSFQFQIGDVAVTGNLSLFSPDEVNALALPLDGFQYVGHIYDLQTTDSLLVGGTIEVRIEYGDVQLIGNQVIDPMLLQLVRIANSQVTLLAFTNDLTNHVLTATYEVSTADQGLDQFGEFAILQAVPTPGTLSLSILGVLCLLARARWRRTDIAACPGSSGCL